MSTRALHLAVVGASGSRTCGVRDHAGLLAGALEDEGVSCSRHWLTCRPGPLRETRATFAAWDAQLAAELRSAKPDAVLLHYSVFSFAHRGVPLFVHGALAPLQGAGVPLVSFMHEFAYPWGLGGPRGVAWAVTQRAALIDVMRASSGVVVTAPSRAAWLASRPWLPRREIGFAPVFSNLPPPAEGTAPARDGTVGLFGYAYEGADMGLVLDALRELRERDPGVRLRLLGAPGADTPAARQWLTAARARGVEAALSFSGVLGAQELSDELARCDVLLHPEPSGPTARKGTLAGSLASARPVVALDGPRSWRELVDAQAAAVVAPRAEALAETVGRLLGEPRLADELGARGGEFARRQMGLERSARAVREALDTALSGARRDLAARAV